MVGNHGCVHSHADVHGQAPWWVFLLLVLAFPFLPLLLVAVWIPGVVPRLAVLAGLAAVALVVRVAARRRRPRSPAVFAWVLPYGLMMWAGWSAAGWAEAIEYRADCTSRWDNRSAQSSDGADMSHGRAAYLRECIRAQRTAADKRSREPDARCLMMQDSSGCPNSVLRNPWPSCPARSVPPASSSPWPGGPSPEEPPRLRFGPCSEGARPWSGSAPMIPQ